MKLPFMETDYTLYRHEYKYEINAKQIEMLKVHLSSIVSLDSHVGEKMKYNIRSLYFDDCYNTCYYENQNGVSPREKFRIRIYNYSDERITLELKRKDHDKTFKQSCAISKENVLRLIEGDNLLWDDNMDPLLKKLYVLVYTRMMKPKIIVE